TIVISYGMWQQDLGGDRNIVGREIQISGQSVMVIGVMPRDFFFPNPEFRAWRPLQLDPSTAFYTNVGYLTLVRRARLGGAGAVIDADIKRIARALGQRFT